MTEEPKPASASTTTRNTDAAAMVTFDDPGDFERAGRGLVCTHETGVITLNDRPITDVGRYDFLRTGDDAPPSVHPGLWRQARLNSIHGLFEVMPGVWQARGYDISNITFMAGDEGWVIIDPLSTAATAAACLELANSQLGERPVTAVIYTHSHVDHFGGVHGVTTQEAVDAGDVRIIAPEGFMEEVVSENVIAGPIMARRAMYQFGPLLPVGPLGQVDIGLGQALPIGATGLIGPTETVSETGTELIIDGIRTVFQNTPDAEAPAEMNFFFPDKRLLCMAENCSHNIHNLYPLRGAQTRNALAWSKYIHEALLMWGDDTDVMFASHHWPRFGTDDAKNFLAIQRDVYRWMHDQTMRLANRGYTPSEIAEELVLPEAFSTESHVQGYYGTVSHNVRSVYNRYLGWYDGNPAHLNPHPSVPAAQRYVEFMGGADEVLRKARASFDEGDYRWVAQVVNHVVFAHPDNSEARHLQADALEQLGYQAESGTWRNAYLTGAQELRSTYIKIPMKIAAHIAPAMGIEHLVDATAVRFDPSRWSRGDTTIAATFVDLDETHLLGVARATVHHTPEGNGEPSAADVAVSLTRVQWAELLGQDLTIDELLAGDPNSVSGDADALREFFAAMDVFESPAIVEP